MLDALVVGGGVAGVTAARALMRAGARVLLLEARQRVGGRIATGSLAGRPYERGGEFIDDLEGPLTRSLADLGVGLLPAATDRDHGPPGSYLLGGKRSLGADVPGGEATTDLLEELEMELEILGVRLDRRRPWEMRGAEEMDSLSIAGWLRSRGASVQTLAVAEAVYGVGSLTISTEDASLLAMAAKQAGRAPKERRLALRLSGGAAAFEVAAREHLGDTLRLGARVRSLDRAGGTVTLGLEDGGTQRARLALFSLPLAPLGRIAERPRPPQARRRALAELRSGDVVKVHLAYERSWWEGILPALTDDVCGHVYEAASGEGPPVLACFVGAAPARRLLALPAAEREGSVLRALDLVAGRGLPPPLEVAMDAWNEEPESGGSYLVYRCGELCRHRDALSRPYGLVIPAAAETSTMPSFIAGAAEAGERGAAEALARL